jgi:hypothetical protein
MENLSPPQLARAFCEGRSTLAELPLCRTSPNFDYAIENLDAFEWAGLGQLRAVFAT